MNCCVCSDRDEGKAETMCNDHGNDIPYSAHLGAFSETHMPVRFPTAAPNLEPRADIWPTDTAPVIRQVEDGLGFAQLC
jgi:hypothetical protein